MKMSHHSPWLWRPAGATVVASLAMPLFLAGCGSKQAPAPPPTQPVANSSLTTKQKVVLLAGAAALYYVYNRYKKQNAAKLQGQNIQYYLSKNGRVYYRDPSNPDPKTNFVWVTPPPSQAPSIRVSDSEASDYSKFQGYDNASSGTELSDVFQVK